MEELADLEGMIKDYVVDLYSNHAGNALKYHNLEHTEGVVRNVSEISSHYKMDKFVTSVLLIAAWFHDTGHLFGPPEMHEDRSVEIMKTYLNTRGVDDSIVRMIENCIYATKLPHQPKSILDEIMCDADTFHFGTDSFLKTDELLQEEMRMRGQNVENWDQRTLELLRNHRYFTKYCCDLLASGKERNIEGLNFRLLNYN